MIVIEGPDGGGKTTLVRHLAKEFDLEVGTRGVTNRDFLYKVTRQDTYRALSYGVLGGYPAQIWDRLFVSEFVYADIVGRPCEFTPYERDFIVDVMNAIRFPMVVCIPPIQIVRENVAKAKQMEGVNENVNTIYDRYLDPRLPWPANTIFYDYTKANSHYASLKEVEDEVAGYLDDRREREPWPRQS